MNNKINKEGRRSMNASPTRNHRQGTQQDTKQNRTRHKAKKGQCKTLGKAVCAKFKPDTDKQTAADKTPN
jgi:hypothetical protein